MGYNGQDKTLQNQTACLITWTRNVTYLEGSGITDLWENVKKIYLATSERHVDFQGAKL